MSKSKKESNIIKKNKIKIILLGETGVGKTNLINVFFNKHFNEDSDTTFSPEFSQKKIKIGNNSYILDVWDTAGQEKFSSITKIFVKGAHIVIFVYDITNEETFRKLPFWVKTVDELLWENSIFGLAANKIDLFAKEKVSNEEGKKYAKDIDAVFWETSAKEDPKGLNEFVLTLVKKVIDNNKFRKIEEQRLTLQSGSKAKSKCC